MKVLGVSGSPRKDSVTAQLDVDLPCQPLDLVRGVPRDLLSYRRQGDGPVHRTRIQKTKSETCGQIPSHAALSRSRRPVHRDDHLLTLRIEDAAHEIHTQIYIPDQDGSALSSRVKIPGYAIKRTDIVEKKHSYKTRRGDPRFANDDQATYSQLIYGI